MSYTNLREKNISSNGGIFHMKPVYQNMLQIIASANNTPGIVVVSTFCDNSKWTHGYANTAFNFSDKAATTGAVFTASGQQVLHQRGR